MLGRARAGSKQCPQSSKWSKFTFRGRRGSCGKRAYAVGWPARSEGRRRWVMEGFVCRISCRTRKAPRALAHLRCRTTSSLATLFRRRPRICISISRRRPRVGPMASSGDTAFRHLEGPLQGGFGPTRDIPLLPKLVSATIDTDEIGARVLPTRRKRKRRPRSHSLTARQA